MLQDYGRPPILYCDQCAMYNHFNPIILSHIYNSHPIVFNHLSQSSHPKYEGYRRTRCPVWALVVTLLLLVMVCLLCVYDYFDGG